MTIDNEALALIYMLEPQDEYVKKMKANRCQPQGVSIKNVDTCFKT